MGALRNKYGKLTPSQVKAAIMEAKGMTSAEICEAVPVHHTTLARWRKDDKYCSLVREEIRREVSGKIPKAFNLLAKQIDDPNGWLAQAAAKELIRIDGVNNGEAQATVQVVFGGEVPEPGMPEKFSEDSN